MNRSAHTLTPYRGTKEEGTKIFSGHLEQWYKGG
jgi:hypothetical protein